MAPAQGWYAQIEKCKQFLMLRAKQVFKHITLAPLTPGWKYDKGNEYEIQTNKYGINVNMHRN